MTDAPHGMRTEQVTGWTVEAILGSGLSRLSEPLLAQVPGCVHLDLIANDRIADLTVSGREADQVWVSQTTWRFRTTVRRPDRPFDRAMLVFEGIDTVAQVRVDGTLRLEAQDMFRSHELDLTADFADREEVLLTVDVEPAVDLARAREEHRPLPRPAAYSLPYNQIRKMACSFGWDWGPVTMTAGLWRPVTLRSWSHGRLSDVRVRADSSAPTGMLTEGKGPDPGSGTPWVSVQAEVDGIATTVTVTVFGPDRPGGGHDGDGTAIATVTSSVIDRQALIELAVPGAQLWWPKGEGAQPLYVVRVTLADDQGHRLDERRYVVGFRTVELVERPDDAGRSFELHINGRRSWIRGLNWIPDDLFPSRISPKRYADRLGEAAAAGANAIRVWGGGLLEDEAFYDACDTLGLLVIQDFPFACAAYPQDARTVTEVTAEVEDNVRRLRHRASLAMWCGNNENLWGHEDWGWRDALQGGPWGEYYYYELLPELLDRLDGTRPYVPGSPFSRDGAHPNSQGSGMTHIWDVWNDLDYSEYERKEPRFVAEFGYQAPGSWPTLVTAVGAPLDPADPDLALHQKADSGDAKLQAGLDRHFAHPPRRGPAWYFATQLLQARALSTGIAHFRSLHDLCSGVIWWQLNDCWPAISWSVIDVRGRRKLAWHALRRVYDPRLVTVTQDPAGPRVHLVNDADEPWTDRLTVRVAAAQSSTVVLELDVQVPTGGTFSQSLPLPQPDGLVIVADVGFRRATRWLVDDRTLTLAEQGTDVRVESSEGAVRVYATARTLIRDLCLLAEVAEAEARVEPQLVTLLPGETACFTVTSRAGPLDANTSWVDLLWSDNRLREPMADWDSPSGSATITIE